MDYNVES